MKLDKLKIRSIVDDDVYDIIVIENESFEFPWSTDDFITFLYEHRNAALVVEYQYEVIGYAFYRTEKKKLYLYNFAIKAEYRQRGIGTMLFKQVLEKLNKVRCCLIADVRETNLPAQLFFRKNKVRATAVLKDYYRDTPEDAYRMEYAYRPLP